MVEGIGVVVAEPTNGVVSEVRITQIQHLHKVGIVELPLVGLIGQG